MSYAAYRFLSRFACLIGRPYLAARRLSGSDEWSERSGVLPDLPGGGVWIHAASVGEVAAARPIVERLADLRVPVLFTVVTRTGKGVAERSAAEGVAVSFAPVDCVSVVRRALASAAPRCLLLLETELWPNLVVEASTSGVTVGIANARLSERMMRTYLSPLTPYRGLVPHLSFVACQSEADASRYRALGLEEERLSVVGNTKTDALGGPLGEDSSARVRDTLGVPSGSSVVVFGSVRPDEETAIVSAVADLLSARDDVWIIVAPRHLDRVGALVARLEDCGVASVRRTRVREDGGSGARAVVLDTTGELSEVYGVASAAFVGGTLKPYGGHNPLEPAARRVPVLFGPHTESCAESADLLVQSGGGLVVSNSDELSSALRRLVSDTNEAKSMAAKAAAAVDSVRGASDRTVELLRRVGAIRA